MKGIPFRTTKDIVINNTMVGKKIGSKLEK